MSLLSAVRAAYNAVKTTASNLVEWVSGTASLPAVHEALHTLLNERTIAICDDNAAMQTLGADEVKFAYVKGGGFYYYDSADAGSGLEAVDGGYWNPDTSVTLASLVSGTPADGKVPMYNSGSVAWQTPSVTSLSWGNISAKPFANDGTNPTTAGVLSAAGLAVGTTNFVIDGVGNVAVATNKFNVYASTGNVTVSGTLGVTGVTTTHGITNTGTISSIGNISTTADAVVGGNITVANDLTVSNIHCDNDIDCGGISCASISNGGAITSTGGLTTSGGVTATGAVVIGQIGNPSSGGLSVVAGSVIFSAPVPVVISSNIQFTSIGNYASNAAAVTALGLNAVYRNGDNLCITH